MTEDHKILITFFIIFVLIQIIGLISSIYSAKKLGYSWSHYVKYFETDFQAFCVVFLKLELLGVLGYFLFQIIYNNI